MTKLTCTSLSNYWVLLLGKLPMQLGLSHSVVLSKFFLYSCTLNYHKISFYICLSRLILNFKSVVLCLNLKTQRWFSSPSISCWLWGMDKTRQIYGMDMAKLYQKILFVRWRELPKPQKLPQKLLACLGWERVLDPVGMPCKEPNTWGLYAIICCPLSLPQHL